MKEENIINLNYETERIKFEVEVDVSYRIKPHRTKLISKIKKQLKQLPNELNTNTLIVKKVTEIK